MYCRAPFISLSVDDNNISVCCDDERIDIENLSNNEILNCEDISQYINHDIFNKLRLDIHSNNIPKGCIGCSGRYEFDSKKLDTVFNYNMENFNKDTGIIKDFKLGYTKVKVNNTCNSKCVYCSEKRSNMFNEESCYNNTYRGFENLFEKHKDNLAIVAITGGEPFMSPEKVIPIIEERHIYKKIITNGSIYNKDINEAITNAGNMLVEVSLDGTDINEVVRFPNKYSEVRTNIEKLPVEEVLIIFTISSLNIFTAYNDIVKITKEIPKISYFVINYIDYPREYSVFNKDIDSNKVFEELNKLRSLDKVITEHVDRLIMLLVEKSYEKNNS